MIKLDDYEAEREGQEDVQRVEPRGEQNHSDSEESARRLLCVHISYLTIKVTKADAQQQQNDVD